MGRHEELIRKQDAIRVIDELLIQMIRDGCLTIIGELRVKELKQDIENLPAVQSGLFWIPCSKKLPEMHDAGIFKKIGIDKISDHCHITVQTNEGALTLANATLQDGEWHAGFLSNLRIMGMPYEITAWMPLPEPYEGGGDEGVGPE